jgi:very-short-patch-repair endonuclease
MMPKGVYVRTKPIWNKGLTKETDKRVAKYIEKRSKNENWKKAISETHKKLGTKPSSRKGFHHTEEVKRKCGIKPPDFSERMKLSYQNKPQLRELRRQQNPWSFHTNQKEVELHKQRIKEARLKQVIPEQNTSIERFIHSVLTKANIEFQAHVPIYPYQVDVLIRPSLVIEGKGCYWHGCKECGYYSEEITKYDQKRERYLTSLGYKVLSIWEHEIRNNPEIVKNKILAWTMRYAEKLGKEVHQVVIE